MIREAAMAKGQKRSNKEIKKPKQKKVAPAAPVSVANTPATGTTPKQR